VQHDDERLKRGYLFVIRVISAINFPALMGLAVVAPWLVPIVFGDPWLPSVILIQLLSVVALLRSVGNPIGSLLLAKGRADWGFFWNVIGVITRVPVIYLGAYYGGIAGIAGALALAQICYSSANYLFLIRRLLGPCLREYLLSMAPSAALSGVMVIALMFLVLFSGEPSRAGLAGTVVFGMAIYSGLYFLFQRQHLFEIRDLILGR
jgi:O-antigen/teichoic acid export membrane protein